MTALHKLNRRTLLMTVAGGVASTLFGKSSHAQLATIDIKSIAQQALAYQRQAQQLAQQVQSYTTQLRQYENMVQNTISLPMSAWNTVQNTIMQVQRLSNVSMMLGGQSATLMSRLNGATGYISQVGGMANITTQYSGWSQNAASQMQQTIAALGFNEQQMRSDSGLLATLQVHSQTAEGQMQAIQAGNEMASFTAMQAMQTQQLLATGIQMSTTQMALEQDRRNAERLRTDSFFEPDQLPTTGYERF